MDKSIDDVIAPYCKYISDTPALLSLLYDIDLLPEQIRSHINAARMVVICELFRGLTLEVFESLFSAKEPQNG